MAKPSAKFFDPLGVSNNVSFAPLVIDFLVAGVKMNPARGAFFGAPLVGIFRARVHHDVEVIAHDREGVNPASEDLSNGF